MIRVTATADQPISAASAREAGFATPAFGYIPGWVFRGALAAAWIRTFGEPRHGTTHRDAFIAMFEGDARFSSLLPRDAAFEPLSAMACKYPNTTECLSFAIDRAFSDDAQASHQCAHCHGSLEPLKGQLRGAVTSRRAHVALDEHGRALAGKLYSRESIPKKTVLHGMITGTNEWLLESPPDLIRVGGQRSTSGRCTLHVKSEPTTPPRVLDNMRLVLRCDAPTIVIDHFGRPQLDLDTQEIAARIGVAKHDVVLRQRFARPAVIGGWHTASARPKPKELAIAAGSTFVYELRRPVGASELTALTDAGLGERKREGFGWITVNPAPWTNLVIDDAQSVTVVTDWPALREASPEGAKWCVAQLRERLTEIEMGKLDATDHTSRVSNTVRFNDLSLLQREELQELLAGNDVQTIRHAIAALRKANA